MKQEQDDMEKFFSKAIKGPEEENVATKPEDLSEIANDLTGEYTAVAAVADGTDTEMDEMREKIKEARQRELDEQNQRREEKKRKKLKEKDEKFAIIDDNEYDDDEKEEKKIDVLEKEIENEIVDEENEFVAYLVDRFEKQRRNSSDENIKNFINYIKTGNIHELKKLFPEIFGGESKTFMDLIGDRQDTFMRICNILIDENMEREEKIIAIKNLIEETGMDFKQVSGSKKLSSSSSSRDGLTKFFTWILNPFA